jgi:hypothetical protein
LQTNAHNACIIVVLASFVGPTPFTQRLGTFYLLISLLFRSSLSLLLHLYTSYLTYVLLLFRFFLLLQDLQIGAHVLTFHRDDFHVLFSPFLKSVPTDLQMEKSVVETNRCFFLHLGVAMGLHPYALQVQYTGTPTHSMI